MKVGGLTRRDLLRWSALGAASLVACGDNIDGKPPTDGHAAAILEPEADSFVIAFWGLLTTAIGIEVRGEASGDLAFMTFTEIESYRAHVEVSGLQPDTSYVVTINTDDGIRMTHRVQTLPALAASRPVRIAVSADIDPHPDFESDLIGHVIAAKPELFISLGDFPYTDNGPPAETLTTYRERHLMARAHPPFRALLEATGMRAIYDDHEFRNDWDAMYAVTEAPRYFAAMQAWDEFFPLRGKPDAKYRSWRHGAHLECFLLDARRHRSPNAMPDGPDKTMLGAQQKAWLFAALKASTATFKLVLTSVPLDYGDGNDHWRSFLYERNELYEAVLGIPGVLFMSADQHWFADNRHANNIREFQVGPLARGIGIPMIEWPGAVFKASRMNAAIVDVTPETLTVTALGVGGEEFYAQTLTAAELTPSLQARG